MPDAHDQRVSHHYSLHYPQHEPRQGDPHYHLFEAYKRRHKAAARCHVGERIGEQHCAGGLELHHAHLEFADINGVLLEAIEHDYPAIHDQESLDVWAESEPNFRWLCERHHRSVQAGVHSLAHSDWEASC